MKRSTFKRRTSVPTWKKPPKKVVLSIPKNLGKRLAPKSSILRSEQHLVLVRAQQCLITRRLGGVQAHHADELFPDVRGSDLSDFLAVPLHFTMHDPRFPGSVHQTGAAEAWWEAQGWTASQALGWIATFLRTHYKPDHEKAAHALAQVQRRRAMYGFG